MSIYTASVEGTNVCSAQFGNKEDMLTVGIKRDALKANDFLSVIKS